MQRNQLPTTPEQAFRQFVLRPEFPCLGAKAAFNSESQTVRVFPHLADEESTSALATELQEFARTAPQREYATFIAIFEHPRATDEIEFENLVWKQLRHLHQRDAGRFAWDRNVAADPDDPHFSFSFGGRAFYVIGMHANSSRKARRFPWPALVFNPHAQFERLRSDGKWKHMQDSIRQRDLHLQGSINPMLSDFGERSEARQYSGRAVEENWRAPFPKAVGKCPFAH